MKTLGIIGGFGPETTAQFYLEIINLSRKRLDQYPSILIYNPPIPFELEKDVAGEGQNESKMLPLIIQAAKKLEEAKADFIVIPCNTIHLHIEKIRQAVNIPILSIIEETANQIEKENFKKIGLLATSSTIKNKLYHEPLAKKDIEIIIPDETSQQKIAEIIPNILIGKKTVEDKNFLIETINHMKKNGAEAVVLACTDLPLLIGQKDTHIKLIDTLDILAEAASRELF